MCSRSADRGALPRGPGHQRAAGQVLDAPGPQPRTPPGRRGLALPGGCVLPAPAPAGPPTLSSGSAPRAHPGSSCAAGSPAGSLRSPSAPRSRPDPRFQPRPFPYLGAPRLPGSRPLLRPVAAGTGVGAARAHDCSPSPPRALPTFAWAGERRQPPAPRLPGRARRGRAGKSGSAAGVGARGTPQGPGFLFVRKIIIKTKPKQRAGLSRTFRRAAGGRLTCGDAGTRGGGGARAQ